MSTLKDDIFTISLPGSDLVFTRYLYAKDEVRIALLVSLLQKNDDALFWAYELFYSGFKHELLQLIWKIYYEFFYTLNPSFEAYFLKKQNELQSECFVSNIIQDLLYRPFNTDVFFLQIICNNFDFEIDYHVTAKKITNSIECRINILYWIDNQDYRSLGNWIITVNKSLELVDIYQICLDIFLEKGMKLTKSGLIKEFKNVLLKVNVNPKIILLAKITALISRKEGLKKGRSIYFQSETEDLMCYETVTASPAYRVLQAVELKGINDAQYLGLFRLNRRKYNMNECYWHNWLYHASFSPIWSQRIKMCGGYVDYFSKKVVFINDDCLEKFYELYGYEPDEQKKEIQEKSIIQITKASNWQTFYNQFKKNGLLEIDEEELEELNADAIKYE